MTDKPKMGDVVAIVQKHSSTGVIGSGVRGSSYTTVELAYVDGVKRNGTVVRVRVAGRGYVEKVANMFRASVQVISKPEAQDAARKLAALGGRQWDSTDTLKADILAAVADAAPAAPQSAAADAIPERAILVGAAYAWAIVHAGKDLVGIAARARVRYPNETRVAVYAAAQMSQQRCEDARRVIERTGVECPMPADLARGCIIGSIGICGGDPVPCQPLRVRLKSNGRWTLHHAGMPKVAKWQLVPRQLDILDTIERDGASIGGMRLG